MNKWLRKLLLAGAVIAPLLIAGSALAQTADWCVSPDGVTPVGCAEVSISPAGLLGDFYEGETLLAAQQNPARLMLVPGASHRIDVRNITSTEPGYGTLFVYNDGFVNVSPAAGAVSNATVNTTKKFIRGTANFTCDIKNVTPTDIVMCRVTVDGVVQPDVLPAGTASFILDPGPHTFLVELVGETSTLWTPSSVTLTVNISAGKTSNVKPLFNKMGHLLVTLSVPDVVADFYVDGTLVATQVPGFDMWVSPNKTHKVDAKNITDPLAAGVYKWRDKSGSTSIQPGKDRTLKLTLTKQFIKGFVEITCALPSVQPTDIVACNPSVDGVALAQLLPGQSVVLPYDPGSHTAQIDLVGDQAFLWAPATSSKAVQVYAGSTAKFKPLFTKSAHLIIVTDQPQVLADFYVDGVLIGSQVASVDLWTTANTSHKIEVKNITEPNGPTSFDGFKDSSTTASASAGSEKTVTVKLLKAKVNGSLTIGCLVSNLPAGIPFFCEVWIDGVFRGNVNANSFSGTFYVKAGSHTALIYPAPRDIWTGGTDSLTFSVEAGEDYFYYSFWFVR